MIMSNKTDNNLNTSINEMYKLIGGQIRKMRRITGVTSTELGNLIGVSQQQISRYEIGSTKISLEIILRISQVFGVSPYYFIEDSLLFFTRQHLPDDDNVIPRSTDAGVNTEPETRHRNTECVTAPLMRCCLFIPAEWLHPATVRLSVPPAAQVSAGQRN